MLLFSLNKSVSSKSNKLKSLFTVTQKKNPPNLQTLHILPRLDVKKTKALKKMDLDKRIKMSKKYSEYFYKKYYLSKTCGVKNRLFINEREILDTILVNDNKSCSSELDFLDREVANLFQNLLVDTRQKEGTYKSSHSVGDYLKDKRNEMRNKLFSGKSCFDKGQLESALDWFELALKEYKSNSYPDEFDLSGPDIIGINFAIILCNLRLYTPGSLQTAMKELVKIINLSWGQTYPCFYLKLAEIYFLFKDFSFTLKTLELAVENLKIDNAPLFWPATNILIDDPTTLSTRISSLQNQASTPEQCNATCFFFNSCLSNGNYTQKIYFNSILFTGYVQLKCSINCYFKFHPKCFKSFSKNCENHFLGQNCFTDACNGVFTLFQVFDEKLKCKTTKVHIFQDKNDQKGAPSSIKDSKKSNSIPKPKTTHKVKKQKTEVNVEVPEFKPNNALQVLEIINNEKAPEIDAEYNIKLTDFWSKLDQYPVCESNSDSYIEESDTNSTKSYLNNGESENSVKITEENSVQNENKIWLVNKTNFTGNGVRIMGDQEGDANVLVAENNNVESKAKEKTGAKWDERAPNLAAKEPEMTQSGSKMCENKFKMIAPDPSFAETNLHGPNDFKIDKTVFLKDFSMQFNATSGSNNQNLEIMAMRNSIQMLNSCLYQTEDAYNKLLHKKKCPRCKIDSNEYYNKMVDSWTMTDPYFCSSSVDLRDYKKLNTNVNELEIVNQELKSELAKQRLQYQVQIKELLNKIAAYESHSNVSEPTKMINESNLESPKSFVRCKREILSKITPTPTLATNKDAVKTQGTLEVAQNNCAALEVLNLTSSSKTDTKSEETLCEKSGKNRSIIIFLKKYFHNRTDEELEKALTEVRIQNGGKLSGLHAKQIANEVKNYFKKMEASSKSSLGQISTNDNICPICLDNLKIDDQKVSLCCRHNFHTDCIRIWLKTNSICPICRVYTLMDDEYPLLV